MSICLKSLKNNLLFVFLFFCGISLSSAENTNKSTFASNGRIQFDYIFWGADYGDDFLSGPYLKSTDLFIKGILGNKSLSYFLHLNFLNTSMKSNLSQGYIKYIYEDIVYKFGQIIVPFGLEQSIDSGNKVFMESASIQGINSNKYFGLNIKFGNDRITHSLSLVIPELEYSSKRIRQLKYSALLRTTLTPIKNNDFLHLGFSFKVSQTDFEEVSPSANIAFKDTPSFINAISLLSSHASILPRHYILGLEYASIVNSLSFQSEIFHLSSYWKDYDREDYYVGYAQIAYIITGESRKYDKFLGSIFDPRPFSEYGLFEVAFRYSYTNLVNKGSLLRGVSRSDGYKNTFVFGVNWIMNQSFKLQFNYASEKYVFRGEGKRKRNISGLGVRVQFLF